MGGGGDEGEVEGAEEGEGAGEEGERHEKEEEKQTKAAQVELVWGLSTQISDTATIPKRA